jgi:thiamine kinase-like enzyme
MTQDVNKEAKDKIDNSLQSLHRKLVDHKSGKEEMSVVELLEAADKLITHLAQKVKVYENNMLVADREIKKLRKKKGIEVVNG